MVNVVQNFHLLRQCCLRFVLSTHNLSYDRDAVRYEDGIEYHDDYLDHHFSLVLGHCCTGTHDYSLVCSAFILAEHRVFRVSEKGDPGALVGIFKEHGGPDPSTVGYVEAKKEHQNEQTQALSSDAFMQYRLRNIVHVFGVFEKLDSPEHLEQFENLAQPLQFDDAHECKIALTLLVLAFSVVYDVPKLQDR